MKLLLIGSIVLSSVFAFSASNEKCVTEAFIMGKDLTKCRCCWGWMVKINDKIYLVDEIPNIEVDYDMSKPNQLFEEPISVMISYQFVEGSCDNRIEIDCLEKVANKAPH